MPLNKPLDDITEADLQALITNKEAEQKSTDYKKALILSVDKTKEEFRADMTSFANSLGGHLVIGMEEAAGFPTALVGQDIANIDAFKLQMDEVLQTKITPRIPGIGIHTIQLSNQKWAVVVRIPKSFAKPHQVVVNKDDFQFWARNSAGKYRMTVDELRSVFLQSEVVAERMRQFRMERIGSITAEDTPVKIHAGAKLILHVLPLSSFDTGSLCDVSIMQTIISDRQLCTLTDINQEVGIVGRYNIDGYVAYLPFYGRPTFPSYIQIFRNGVIEYVDTFWFDPRQTGNTASWNYAAEKALIECVRRSLLVQSTKLGISAPTAIMVSLAGAKDCMIDFSSYHLISVAPFGTDMILLPETIAMTSDADPNRLLQPILDALWNAGGFPKCYHYDANGILQEPQQ